MTYATAVSNDIPAAFWQFIESSGASTLQDYANSHNGTYYGTKTSVTGIAGVGAIQFDGSTGQAQTSWAWPSGISEWTVEFLIKGPGSRGTVMANTPDDTYGYPLIVKYESSSTIKFAVSSNGGNTGYVSLPCPAGTWTHYAITFIGTSGTYVKAYINGTLYNTTTIGTGNASIYSGGYYFNFGDGVGYDGSQYWDGTIAAAAVWMGGTGAALTDAKIAAHVFELGFPTAHLNASSTMSVGSTFAATTAAAALASTSRMDVNRRYGQASLSSSSSMAVGYTTGNYPTGGTSFTAVSSFAVAASRIVTQSIQLSSLSFLSVNLQRNGTTNLRSISRMLLTTTGSITTTNLSFTFDLAPAQPERKSLSDIGAENATPTSPGGGEAPLRIAMGFTGQQVVYPARTSWNQARAIPGIVVTVPQPSMLQGQAYVPALWAQSDSTLGVSTGAGHITVVPDPDPALDPPTATTHPDSGYTPGSRPGGTSTYRWLASDVPYTGDYFETWPSHGAGPDWKSVFPYRPKVRDHHAYGTGANAQNYRAIFFNPTYVEHMWLDWGHAIPQPYTWVFCGIPLQYEGAHDGHYMLDAGRAKPVSTVELARTDRIVSDGLSTRSLVLSKRDSILINTNHSVGEGVYTEVSHSWSPVPTVTVAVFDGSSSYVSAMDAHDANTAKGRTSVVSNRYFVLGRAQDRLSDNYASNMALFEVRFFDYALTPVEISRQQQQLAATYKFNLY